MDVDAYLEQMAGRAVQEASRVLAPADQSEPEPRGIEVLDGAGAGCCTVRARLNPALTVVVKMHSLVHEESESLSDVPGAVDYWRREWLFYRASWSRQLPEGLTPPSCLASGEFVDDAGRPVTWVALEDLGPNDRNWSISSFGHVARQAGAFNGWSVAGASAPAEVWLTSGWLMHEAERGAIALPTILRHVDHPVLGRIVDRGYLDDVAAFWTARDMIADTVRALPQVLCHNDLYPRNVFAGPTRSVALDWAYVGWGMVGQELSALIGASAIFRTRPAAEWAEVETRTLAGYLLGLRDAEWSGSEGEVRLGYELAFALRYGVDILPALADTTLDPDLYDIIAEFTGCSYEEYVVNMRALIEFTHERLGRVRAELGI